MKSINDVKFWINKLKFANLIDNVTVDDQDHIFFFNKAGVKFMVYVDQRFNERIIQVFSPKKGKYVGGSYFSDLTDLKNKVINRKPIAEEMINELYSKRPASLAEIVDGSENPSKDEILKSKDFQVNLINDLVNNKRNVKSWEVYDKKGSIEDLRGTDDNRFNIDYDFNFTYNYKGVDIPLTLFINGDVDVDWVGSYRSASHWNPAEYPEPEIDQRSLGRMLDLALFDDDGSEIGLTWLTPELETQVVKSIISPYL